MRFKIISSFIFFVFLNFFLVSAQVDKVTLKGNILSEEKFILLIRNTGPLGIDTHLDSIPITKTGDFEFQFKLSKPENFSLNFGKQQLRLWLEKNTTLILNLKDSGSTFTGSKSSYAYYYLAQQDETKRLYQELEKRHRNYDKKESLFSNLYFKINDSLTHGQIVFLNNYFRCINLKDKKDFIAHETASLEYSNLYYKGNAPDSLFKKFAIFESENSSDETSQYSYLNKIILDRRNILKLYYYQRFVSTSIPRIARQMLAEQGKIFSFDIWMDKQMAIIDQFSKDSYCNLHNKIIIINEFVKQIGYSRRIQWADKLYSLVAQLQSKDDEKVLKGIKQRLDDLVRETKYLKGATAPPFSLTDIKGKIIHLEDFRGKKVYIDIWATWCGPCIKLEPDMEKLAKAYGTSDSIVFLSISIDVSRDSWLKYINLHQSSSIQLYAGPRGTNNTFADDYGINFIPHFILIDKNEKFISYLAPEPDKFEDIKLLFSQN